MEEVVKQVRQNLKTTQDHQKNYANFKILTKNFNVGDNVYLKMKPKKSTLRLGSCAKLSHRYCLPCEVLAKVVPMLIIFPFQQT